MRRQQHDTVCKALLRDSCDTVNKIIDFPSMFLGANHRKIFHSIPEAMVLGAIFHKNKVKGAAAGLLHIACDWFDTVNKKVMRNGR